MKNTKWTTMIEEANRSWNSNFPHTENGEGLLQLVRGFGWSREKFVQEWVWNVYGERI